MIQDHEGNAPQNAHNRIENPQFVCDYSLNRATRYGPGEVSLTPNALTTRNLPYFLLDIDREAAVAYAVLARDAGVRLAHAIPTDPEIVVCPSPLPDWTTPRLNSDLQRGLRDLLVQGLAWSLQPHALDGLVPPLRPPYALYWSHVIPTAEILAALQNQSREEGAGLR